MPFPRDSQLSTFLREAQDFPTHQGPFLFYDSPTPKEIIIEVSNGMKDSFGDS